MKSSESESMATYWEATPRPQSPSPAARRPLWEEVNLELGTQFLGSLDGNSSSPRNSRTSTVPVGKTGFDSIAPGSPPSRTNARRPYVSPMQQAALRRAARAALTQVRRPRDS